MFVAAVRAPDRIDGAAVATMTRRAAKFLERMPANQVRVRMAGEWRIIAFSKTKISFCNREKSGNILRGGANVTGLAAVHQARATKVVDGSARRIHVDLNNFLVEVAHALEQTLERCGT